MSIKRLNYFTHQFLREQDFKDEQAYHREMRYRHNRLLYGWGVMDGLEVHKKNEREITIDPGTGIDDQGRELILTHSVSRDLGSFERSSHTYITLAYADHRMRFLPKIEPRDWPVAEVWYAAAGKWQSFPLAGR